MTPDLSRQLDPEGTRAAILEAAQAHFVAQGYAATSMAAIAKDAGVTKSLIHHHFGSKQDLWDAVKTKLTMGYHQAQANLLEEREPDLKLMEESIITYFRFLQRNPDMVRMVTWMAVEGDEACNVMLDELTERGLEVLKKGQDLGYLRSDLAPQTMLAMFFTLVRGWFTERPLLTACVDGLEDDGDEAYLRAVLRVYLQGLEPPTGTSNP